MSDVEFVQLHRCGDEFRHSVRLESRTELQTHGPLADEPLVLCFYVPSFTYATHLRIEPEQSLDHTP